MVVNNGDVLECSRSVWQDDWRDGLAGASESHAWCETHEAEVAWRIIGLKTRLQVKRGII